MSRAEAKCTFPFSSRRCAARGYEFQVSTPHVLNKEIDGKLCEPIERMVADVPENSVGSVIDKMAQRKGELVSMTPIGSRMRLEFLVPTRVCSATATNF